MTYISHDGKGTVALQATLAAATSEQSLHGEIQGPHHPVACLGQLGLDEDGTMWCDHSKAGPENLRNQAIIDATTAILLIELLWEKENKKAPSPKKD